MKVSAKSEYGLLALLYLTCHGPRGPVAVATMAEDLAIPRRFLEQIVAEFKRGGIVQSLRGAHGGYRLARDPASITIREIFRVTEGSFLREFSAVGLERADQRLSAHENIQVVQQVWKSLHGSVDHLLNSITLKQMCEQANQLKHERPMSLAATAPGTPSS